MLLLALPAFVAIWSGWVGLGGLTGFGIVHPLPGIWDELAVNTAITLPIGVETYAAYALHVWLSRAVDGTATAFAKWSALGSLILGAGGQVAYHLMVAAGMRQAPWQITAVVACLPVAVLGMGAALAHLVSAEPAFASVAEVGDAAPLDVPAPGYRVLDDARVEPVEVLAPEPVQEPAPVEATQRQPRPAPRAVSAAGGRRAGRPAGSSTSAVLVQLRAEHPDWTLAQIADKAGCSVRTARRHLNTPSTSNVAPAVDTAA